MNDTLKEQLFSSLDSVYDGDKDEGIIRLRQLLSANPAESLAYYCLQAAITANHSPYSLSEEVKRESEVLLEKALALPNTVPGIYIRYAETFPFTERTRNLLDEAIQRWPKNPYLHVLRLKSLPFGEADGDEVLPFINNRDNIEDKNVVLECYNVAVGAYVSTGRMGEALSLLNQAKEWEPEITVDQDLLYFLGFIANDQDLLSATYHNFKGRAAGATYVSESVTAAALSVGARRLGLLAESKEHLQRMIQQMREGEYEEPIPCAPIHGYGLSCDLPYQQVICSISNEERQGVAALINMSLSNYFDQLEFAHTYSDHLKDVDVEHLTAITEPWPTFTTCRWRYIAALHRGDWQEAVNAALDAYVESHEVGKGDELYLEIHKEEDKLSAKISKTALREVTERFPHMHDKGDGAPAAYRKFYRDFLRDRLMDKKMYIELKTVCEELLKDGETANELFTLAYVQFKLGNREESERLYRTQIASEDPWAASYYNLAIEMEKKDLNEAVRLMEEALTLTDDEDYSSYYKRLKTKKKERDRLYASEQVHPPGAEQAYVPIESLSTTQLIYLVATTTILQKEEQGLMLYCEVPERLTPYTDFDKILFQRMRYTGALLVDADSAYHFCEVGKNGSLINCKEDRLSYVLNVESETIASGATPFSMMAISEIARRHVVSEGAVLEELLELWQELGVWELLAYLQLRLDSYGYHYTISDNTKELIGDLLKHFNIRQGYYFIWAATAGAVAYQKEKKITDQHAVNVAISSIKSRLSKALEDGRDIPLYNRPKDIPLCSLACVLISVAGLDEAYESMTPSLKCLKANFALTDSVVVDAPTN